MKFEIIFKSCNHHETYTMLLYVEAKKIIKDALHFNVVIKKVGHNSVHVYNEYVDCRYDVINEGRDDERAETKK